MKNFLEKDLESIIWENFERCEPKGLTLNQNFYATGLKYRQLNLAPYGIADLIYVCYDSMNRVYRVMVVELKRGKIDLAAYQQAKRYLTAMHVLLRKSKKPGDMTPFHFTSVLVGSEIEKNGDFLFVYNYDDSCRAFTYSYGFDGIEFEEVNKEWRIGDGLTVPSTLALAQDIADHRADMEDSYMFWQIDKSKEEEQARQENIRLHGDYSQALVITADGVMINEGLLEEPEEDQA